jgi:hypothetical protein
MAAVRGWLQILANNGQSGPAVILAIRATAAV